MIFNVHALLPPLVFHQTPFSDRSTMTSSSTATTVTHQNTSAAPLVFLSPLYYDQYLNIPQGRRHTRARSVCIASAPAVTWSCILCIRDGGQPSLSSWLSCERPASSDLHIRIVFYRIVAFLARKQKPGTAASLDTHCIKLMRR